MIYDRGWRARRNMCSMLIELSGHTKIDSTTSLSVHQDEIVVFSRTCCVTSISPLTTFRRGVLNIFLFFLLSFVFCLSVFLSRYHFLSALHSGL